MEDTELLAKAMEIIRRQEVLIDSLMTDCADLISILKGYSGEPEEKPVVLM